MPTSQGPVLGAKPGTESVPSRYGHSFSSWQGHGDNLVHHPAVQGQDRKTETQAGRRPPGHTAGPAAATPAVSSLPAELGGSPVPNPSLVPGPQRRVAALSSQGPLFFTSAAPHLTLSFIFSIAFPNNLGGRDDPISQMGRPRHTGWVPATHGYRPGLDGVTVQSYFLPPATPVSLLLLPESCGEKGGLGVSV